MVGWVYAKQGNENLLFQYAGAADSVQLTTVAATEGAPSTVPLPITGRLWARQMIAFAAGLGMFMSALDISVNVALPYMTRDLGASLQSVQWVIVVYVASRAGLVMSAGSFADRFGLRRVYVFGAAVYLAAMVCIGLSPSLWPVVGFRALQALGSGCLFAVSPAIAARLFPESRRGLAMGFAIGSMALGMLTGTLGAGALAQWYGWEAIFLGRVPFALLSLVLGIWWMSGEKPASAGGAFDVPGALTMFGALICLVVGLRLGTSLGWTSPIVLTLLPLAPAFMFAFWRIEARAAWPVLPREMLAAPGVVMSCLSMFTAHLGVFVIWFIFPFYVGDIIRGQATVLGSLFAVMAALNTGASGVGGWLCDKIGTLKVGLAGLAALLAGMAWIGFLDAGATFAGLSFRVALIGAGMGLFHAASLTYMMNSAPPGRLGAAASALSLAQSCGTVFSVAVMGGAFSLLRGRFLEGLTGAGTGAGDAETQAFMQAFRAVFWLGAALIVLSAAMYLLGRRRRAGGTSAKPKQPAA